MSSNDKTYILVVDDDRDICESIVDTLTMHEYVGITAYDGAQAIQKYQKQEFKLIITDLNMPKTSGIKLIQQVKNYDLNKPKKKPVKFLVISGDLAPFQHHLEKLDDVELLPKPFSPDDMIDLIKSILNDKKSEYIFSPDDELLATVTRLMKKISCTILQKEMDPEFSSTHEKLKLEFDGPKIFQISYASKTAIHKLIIELNEVFSQKILEVMVKQHKTDQDQALEKFVQLLVNVFQKSLNKRFNNLKFFDMSIAQGYLSEISSKQMNCFESADFNIYNIKLTNT